MSIEREEFEQMLAVTLNAVNEQYILPLSLALATLTAAIARNPDSDLSKQVSEALYQQAASTPVDVAGRQMLISLAELAAGQKDDEAIRNALRKVLRPL